MKQIAKGSSVLTAVSIGEMAMRFVRTKFIALILGPSGTGFLAQLTILFEVLRIWGDLGSRRGVIKQIAEQRLIDTATPAYRSVINTSFFLAATATLIVGGIVAFFSPQISQLLFDTPEKAPFIVALALLLPAASFCTVIASIVKGNLDYLSFAKYTLSAYGVAILMTPGLIYFFKLWGAIISMGLFFILPLISYLVLNAKKRFLFFSRDINTKSLKEQFSFGFLQIYQDTLANVVRLAVATWIVRELGFSLMGIYQVVLTFTTVYMAVPIHAMSGYVFPLIAGSKKPEEINQAVNESLRFLMFVLVPVITGIMILPEPLIYVFFSAEFLPAANILQIQLFSTLFMLMTYSFAAALMAKGKLKSVYIMATVNTILFIILALFLFPQWQLSGIATAYGLSSMSGFIMHYAFVRHYFGIRLLPKNQRLVFMTFGWVLLTFICMTFFDHPAVRAALLCGGILWFMISSRDHERKFLFDKLKSYLRRPVLAKR